jgi:Protein of unknown function (DUF3579)
MDTVLDPVSTAPAEAPDHPLVQLPTPRSEPTQSAAVFVQPGNAPVAQTVEPPTVSATPPVGSASAVAVVKPREVFIQGITPDGRAFRPSDWAERLAGAMSSFRPGGAKMGIAAHIGYSPYCVPTSIGNIKCVVVNESLRKIEPMAWDFVMNFAKDNNLTVVDACLLPD